MVKAEADRKMELQKHM